MKIYTKVVFLTNKLRSVFKYINIFPKTASMVHFHFSINTTQLTFSLMISFDSYAFEFGDGWVRKFVQCVYTVYFHRLYKLTMKILSWADNYSSYQCFFQHRLLDFYLSNNEMSQIILYRCRYIEYNTTFKILFYT